jgi:hypothetical protein
VDNNLGGDDAVVDKMLRLGMQMIRENYLNMAYLGNPPEELPAEEEAELPEQFRLESGEDFE